MIDTATKLPVKSETKTTTLPAETWHPFESLRHSIDRLFDDFDGGFREFPRRSLFDLAPFRRVEAAINAPAVDISDKAGNYEITAELPGIDEKDIEVKLVEGGLLIKGEKKEEKEEKKKNYFLSERHFGSFQRYFSLPEGIDADKISATFKKGVLTVTLPKSPEAKKLEKRIPVAAG